MRVHEEMNGHDATNAREQLKALTANAYTKMIEEWIANNVIGAQVSRIIPKDDPVQGKHTLDVDFTARQYGKLIQDRLLTFNATMVSRRNRVSLTAPTRKLPVVLEAGAFSETVEVKLPDGFDVDELPGEVKLSYSFGNYTAGYSVKENQLRYQRCLVVHNAVIPPEQYTEVRNFFRAILSAEQAPVVLVKK
jgi:hypothetical protein